MIPHDKLTIIRNRHRVGELARFRHAVELYFERTEYVDDLPVDWAGARDARAQINRRLPRVIDIVTAAGLGDRGSAPGQQGGGVELIRGMFDARDPGRAEEEILDLLDMAIGVYQANLFSAMWRTVNPLHYTGVALGYVLGLPKKGLTALGVVKMESHAEPMLAPEQVTLFENVAARLADGQDSIETRLAEMGDHQERRMLEQGEHLAELAERLEFAERLMTRGKSNKPAIASPEEEAITPG